MMRGIFAILGGLSMATAAFAADPFDGWSKRSVEVELAAALETHAPVKKLMSLSSLSRTAKVRVVEGDLAIDGALLSDWKQGHGAAGLIVTGALSVNGPIINASRNGGPFLVVAGKTRAKAIVAGGAEFLFVGDAEVEEIVVGEYNDGILRFLGALKVPVAVTNDHHFEVGGKFDGRWLDPFDEGHAWASVLHADIAVSKDEDGNEDFDVVDQLLPRIRSGQPVLRSDLPAKADYPAPFD
jgi:hypothetical protein